MIGQSSIWKQYLSMYNNDTFFDDLAFFYRNLLLSFISVSESHFQLMMNCIINKNSKHWRLEVEIYIKYRKQKNILLNCSADQWCYTRNGQKLFFRIYHGIPQLLCQTRFQIIIKTSHKKSKPNLNCYRSNRQALSGHILRIYNSWKQNNSTN